MNHLQTVLTNTEKTMMGEMKQWTLTIIIINKNKCALHTVIFELPVNKNNTNSFGSNCIKT